MKKLKQKSLFQWLMPKIRKYSVYWRGKKEARNLAKVLIAEGQYKNGKQKFKTYYTCAECERQNLDVTYHDISMTQMDHIQPVINVQVSMVIGIRL